MFIKFPLLVKSVLSFLVYTAFFVTIFSCKKTIRVTENSDSLLSFYTGGMNDKVENVVNTNDGGFLYCGFTGPDSGNTDAFLLKVDSLGKKQWYKTYGGANFDAFHHAIQCSDGTYIAVGKTNSIGQGVKDSSFLVVDYTVKTDANGELVWSKSFSTTASALFNIVESTNHYFYITGVVNSISANPDVLFCKLNLDGNKIVFKALNAFTSYPPYIIQKTYVDIGNSISINKNGDIMIGGVMNHTSLSANTGEFITFLVSTNTNGTVKFFYPYYNYIRSFGYLDAFNRRFELYKVKVINYNNGYLIATFLELASGKLSLQLLQTDALGNVVKEKQFSGLGNALFEDIRMEPDSSLILLGASSNQDVDVAFPAGFPYLKCMVIKLNKNWDEEYVTYYGSNTDASLGKCLQLRNNGELVVAGYTRLSGLANDKMFRMELNKEATLKIK